jgi:hypothetical protein
VARSPYTTVAIALSLKIVDRTLMIYDPSTLQSMEELQLLSVKGVL